MSRSHSIHAASVSDMLKDVETLTAAELYSLHGIKIESADSIHDEVNGTTYDNIHQWAEAVVAETEMEYEEVILVGNHWDDQ